MSDNMFDPDQFMDMTIDDANSTSVEPVPEGDWKAIADDVKVRPWQSRKDPSKSGLALDVVWQLDDPELPEQFQGRKAKQGIMLDLTDDGQLDMSKGQNVSLGRLRTAIGKNNPGESFAFSMIPGNMAQVRIKHRQPDDQPDPENPIIYTDVAGVAPIS